jgi:hypothetical protein
MCVNAKMIPVETVTGNGGGMKETIGRDKISRIYLIHYKNLCK